MNKLFIGLLIIAAGAGIFFLLRKKEHTVTQRIDRELLIGKWMQTSADSTASPFYFDFQEKNLLIRSLSAQDQVDVDSFYYEWTREDNLEVKKSAGDSASGFMRIFQLTKDSLYVKDGDSSAIVFKRAN